MDQADQKADRMDQCQTTSDRFLHELAQTNPSPYLLDIDRAEGIHLWDKKGNKFMDMIAGVAVTNIGHRHPAVIQAIKQQLDRHLHVMVYGEYIQDAQLDAAAELHSVLPDQLNCTYFVNSGTEANEAALKLAKRHTGRAEIIAFKGAYHGSTHGSLSAGGNELKKSPFRPLIPGIKHIPFNDPSALTAITSATAGVIVETIQGDAGVRIPEPSYLKALRERCDETGALLIFDEVQVGCGRTGKFFAFEHFEVIPDVLTLGKALGGGMPIGALVTDYGIMQSFTQNPMLGHITTFGGHPVICAAAAACIRVLKEENWISEAEKKGKILEDMLVSHPSVVEIRRAGLLYAIEMKSADKVQKVVEKCLQSGLIGFWFLSCPDSFRLSPPLSITEEEIREAGRIILDAFE